ncbi:MAG TPA: hypothetical protein VGL29_10140 [Blastocatellia bacterium]
MKGELLVLHIVGAYPHIGRFHQRLSAGVFATLADDSFKPDPNINFILEADAESSFLALE